VITSLLMRSRTEISRAPSTPSATLVVLAATLGNALEWFDLIVYAFFAIQIAKTFFPADDPNISILLVLGTFGVSYFMRPLGGVVLGVYADRMGRKPALLMSIVLMMLGTLLIAVTPGYAQIGLAAPITIVFARLLQGFSAGGEFASATAFLAEQSIKRRAFYSSWQQASTGLSVFLASAFGVGLSSLVTPQQLTDWAWRIPFFFGLLLGPVAIFIRRRVTETVEFQVTEKVANPLGTALRSLKTRLLLALGVVILATAAMYMIMYMPTYAVSQLGLTSADGFRASLAAGAIVFVVAPLAGLLADRAGASRVAIPMAVLVLLASIPLFSWLAHAPSTHTLVAVQVAMGLPVAAYLGVLPALLIELFPVRTRSTGMSLSYNLSVMTFGGFAPLAINWVITTKRWLAAPGYYLTVAAVLSLIALFAASQMRRQSAA
jgi:MFS transporter, MHS family, proline/betaine transporter